MRLWKWFTVLALPAVAMVASASPAPSAQAEATGIRVVGCEFLLDEIDGDTNDAIFGEDYEICARPPTPEEVRNLADATGDADGVLDPSDLDLLAEQDDNNTLSDACTQVGFFCALTVIAFVDDEGPVTITLEGGLQLEPVGSDLTCDTEAEDADCSTDSSGTPDGVVAFSVVNATATMGDSATIHVEQDALEYTEVVTVVGVPATISLELAEPVVESSRTLALQDECEDTATIADAVPPRNTTLATARARDESNRAIARVFLDFGSSESDIANAASGPPGSFAANDGVTRAQNSGEPAQRFVICGGLEGIATLTVRTIPVDPNSLEAAVDITVVCLEPDADDDCAADFEDNCPALPNGDQLNHDNTPFVTSGAPDDKTVPNGDGLGDACDDDDDNDGLSDSAEESGCVVHGGIRADSFTDVRDSDSDLVVDGAECAFGTYPKGASDYPPAKVAGDTDGDGLPDDIETAIGSDPLRTDTDGDRFIDAMEFKGWATSPTSVDTDGDGCSDSLEIASVNSDSAVNSLDLMLVASSFGRGGRPHHDINKDRNINAMDLSLVARNFAAPACA